MLLFVRKQGKKFEVCEERTEKVIALFSNEKEADEYMTACMADPYVLMQKGMKYDNAMRVLKLLNDKCRQGFLELSEGSEAYDELQAIMLAE